MQASQEQPPNRHQPAPPAAPPKTDSPFDKAAAHDDNASGPQLVLSVAQRMQGPAPAHDTHIWLFCAMPALSNASAVADVNQDLQPAKMPPAMSLSNPRTAEMLNARSTHHHVTVSAFCGGGRQN